MTRRPSSLPDLSDDELARRLNPLAVAILPSQGPIETQSPPSPLAKLNKEESDQEAGDPKRLRSGTSDQVAVVSSAGEDNEPERTRSRHQFEHARLPADRLAAAAHLEQTAATRGERRGIEFLLPERVIKHLRQEAAARGVSMSLRLLQILREASYPVIDEDFIDLRKLPKR